MKTDVLVFIKEVPKNDNIGLGVHNKSKFPGCFDSVQLKREGGRWVTGFDEFAYSVINLPLEERESEQERLKEKREKFERLLGKKDLSGTSEYWENFLLSLDTFKPLNLSNPEDEMTYEIIKANRFALSSLDDRYSEGFEDCFYYLEKENGDIENQVKKDKQFNKAIAKLEELSENNMKHLRTIALYLKLPVNSRTTEEGIYAHVHTFIKNNGERQFLKALEQSEEHISASLLLDKALKFQVIRRSGSLYQRGTITIGNSPEKVIAFLKDPNNILEVQSIEEEVEEKSKYGK